MNFNTIFFNPTSPREGFKAKKGAVPRLVPKDSQHVKLEPWLTRKSNNGGSWGHVRLDGLQVPSMTKGWHHQYNEFTALGRLGNEEKNG